jgi:hypothetical protein
MKVCSMFPRRVGMSAIAFVVAIGPAGAATLTVGAGQSYQTLAAAAAAAKPGDTIDILPGTYDDCADWTAGNITIEGSGVAPQITGLLCLKKPLFAIRGDNVTLKNLAFAGAGDATAVRTQGANLTVLDSTFSGNQNGIVADGKARGTLTVRGTTFTRDGSCATSDSCVRAIDAGGLALLQVTNSTFTGAGESLRSRALETKIINTTITGSATGGLIELPAGGGLYMSGDYLQVARNAKRITAINIGGRGNPSDQILIQNSTFRNDGAPSDFVDNHRTTPAQLVSVVMEGGPVTALSGPGSVGGIRTVAPGSAAIPSADKVRRGGHSPTPSMFASIALLAAMAGLGYLWWARRRPAQRQP